MSTIFEISVNSQNEQGLNQYELFFCYVCVLYVIYICVYMYASMYGQRLIPGVFLNNTLPCFVRVSHWAGSSPFQPGWPWPARAPPVSDLLALSSQLLCRCWGLNADPRSSHLVFFPAPMQTFKIEFSWWNHITNYRCAFHFWLSLLLFVSGVVPKACVSSSSVHVLLWSGRASKG